MIEVVCQVCETKFRVSPSRIKDGAKYCSKECRDNSLKKRVNKICQTCGKEFETIPYHIKNGNGKYCSQKCFGLSRRKRIKRICKNCGKEFETIPAEIKRGGHFCSKSCANSGEYSSAWKGGKSFEPYCILFNDEFKERCREFWGRKCGISGITEEENCQKLSVHHITYDKQTCCNTNVPLFIPLSKEYHAKTNNNREYWEENLTNYIMIWFDGECYNRRVDTKN
jgi:hypothetical protein